MGYILDKGKFFENCPKKENAKSKQSPLTTEWSKLKTIKKQRNFLSLFPSIRERVWCRRHTEEGGSHFSNPASKPQQSLSHDDGKMFILLTNSRKENVFIIFNSSKLSPKFQEEVSTLNYKLLLKNKHIYLHLEYILSCSPKQRI